MDLHENIKLARERLGMSQEALAHKVGYTDRSSIAKIEAGRVDPPTSKISAFANALQVSPAWLLGIPMSEEEALPNGFSSLPKMKQWRVLGATACGTPLHQETPWETVEAPEDIDADVVFRCIGDSMINARIFDGDLVFVRLQPSVENGQIAIVRIGDDYTLKRLYASQDCVELRAENPTVPTILLRGEELGRFEIVGLAVTFLSTVK